MAENTIVQKPGEARAPGPSYQEAMSKICDTSNDNEGQRSN